MKFNGKLQLHTFLRIAICLLVGICIGDATADAVPVALWRWLFVGLLSLLVLLHMSKRLEMMQTLLIFGIIIVGGAWRITSYENSLRCAFTGEEEVYEAVVVSQPIKKRRSMKCELAVVSGRLAGHRLNAYFQNPNSLNHIVIGDGVEAQSVFSGFDDTFAQRGGFDWRRQRMVRGIVARTFVASDKWKRAEVSLEAMPRIDRLALSLQSLRYDLLSRLQGSALTEDSYATIAAMTLGDKTGVSAELRDTYSKAGVSHVLALSGLHLGIIYAMIALLLGRRRNTMGGLFVTLLLVWTFALMVGMSPGIVRSAAMFSVYASMTFLQRDYLTANSLALAASVMLLASPAMLWDVGFQMSFLAVMGIVICHVLLRNNRFYVRYAHRRFVGKLVSLVCISLAAQLFVLPLVMYYFGNVPFYFLLANIVAVPLTTFIIYAAMLLFVLSPLCQFAAWMTVVWQWLASGVGWVVAQMNTLLKGIASLPGASADGVYISVLQLSLMYVLIVALVGVWRYGQQMYDSMHGKFKSEDDLKKLKSKRVKK